MKKSEKKSKKFFFFKPFNISQGKERFREKLNFDKNDFTITSRNILILASFIFVLVLMVGGIYFFSEKRTNSEKIFVCGDGTFYNSCSLTKPYFCANGALLEKASICGCSNSLKKEGDRCVSNYQSFPKEINLKYILRGEEKKINCIVYGGLVDYLFSFPKSINYYNDEKSFRSDFKLKNLNEKEQRELLLPLVIKIQNLTLVKEDQMRIAVSLVQNIPYVESEKTFTIFGTSFNYSRYPYEVLYDGAGICGEKSELLAFLLRELGYEVVFFYYEDENHESIGIRCPVKDSLNGTGYCFIETTGPSIITDDSIEYVGGIKLVSKPEISLISNGYSLEKNLYEYKDANTIGRIRNGGIVLFPSVKFNKLKEKYGLVEKYNLK